MDEELYEIHTDDSFPCLSRWNWKQKKIQKSAANEDMLHCIEAVSSKCSRRYVTWPQSFCFSYVIVWVDGRRGNNWKQHFKGIPVLYFWPALWWNLRKWGREADQGQETDLTWRGITEHFQRVKNWADVQWTFCPGEDSREESVIHLVVRILVLEIQSSDLFFISTQGGGP